MTIYDRIKNLRIKNGLSQYDLAKKVGYEGRSAISKVENGERDISQSMIVKYADALGVSPTYLLYGEEESSTVSNNDDNNTVQAKEFMELFQRLTEEQQKMLIAQMKGLLESFNK